MAGMIQNQTKQAINGLPGLMELPILGPLFKSRDYINQQTELMVLVTPYVVRAVAQKDLSRPDDGFADPSDPATVLLGRLNRIYGVGGNARSGRTTTTANTASSSIEPAQETTMQTIRTMIAGRRSVAAIAVRAAVAAGCALLRLRLQYRPAMSPAVPMFRTTIACVIRSRFRKPTTRSNSSSAPIAAN